MKSLATVRGEAAVRFEKNFLFWSTDGSGSWPLSLALGAPDEKEALTNFEGTARWARQWMDLADSLHIVTAQRLWRTGSQLIPTHIRFISAPELAAFVGRAKEWNRAIERLQQLAADWPAVQPLDRKTFTRLVSLSSLEWQQTRQFLRWVARHPTSGLLPRQLPIPGVDSKWFETHRALCTALRRATAGDEQEGFGLRTLEKLLTLRVLDPQLRAGLAGLGDFSAEPDVLAALRWHPRVVIVCENLQCAYSFGDIEGAVVIAKQGYAVDVLSRLSWLASARIVYWGDLDTHGFAILNRFRSYFPRAESILMDETTLLDNRPLWANEPDQNVQSLSLLTDREQAVLEMLRSSAYGPSVRLEQERIPWAVVAAAFERVLAR